MLTTFALVDASRLAILLGKSWSLNSFVMFCAVLPFPSGVWDWILNLIVSIPVPFIVLTCEHFQVLIITRGPMVL